MPDLVREIGKAVADYQRRQLAHRLITLAAAGVFSASMVALGVLISG